MGTLQQCEVHPQQEEGPKHITNAEISSQARQIVLAEEDHRKLLDKEARRRNSKRRSKNLNNSRIFVTCDFENVDQIDGINTVWWRLAIVTVPFATGKVSEVRYFACNRDAEIARQTQSKVGQFWKNNTLAFSVNSKKDNEMTVDQAERAIAEYIDDLKHRIPNFFFVSDAVAADVVRLDGILTRQGRPSISMRPGDLYLSTASIWSYSLAIAHILKCRAKDIKKHPMYKRSHVFRIIDQIAGLDNQSRPGAPLPPSESNQPLMQMLDDKTPLYFVRHTPVYDCITSLSRYFSLLDVATELSASIE
jgi:hypothetical protein